MCFRFSLGRSFPRQISSGNQTHLACRPADADETGGACVGSGDEQGESSLRRRRRHRRAAFTTAPRATRDGKISREKNQAGKSRPALFLRKSGRPMGAPEDPDAKPERTLPPRLRWAGTAATCLRDLTVRACERGSMDEGRKGIARDASGLEGPERWIGELPAIDKTKKTMKNAVCFQPSAINITRWVPCGARRGLNAARKADTFVRDRSSDDRPRRVRPSVVDNRRTLSSPAKEKSRHLRGPDSTYAGKKAVCMCCLAHRVGRRGHSGKRRCAGKRVSHGVARWTLTDERSVTALLEVGTDVRVCRSRVELWRGS